MARKRYTNTMYHAGTVFGKTLIRQIIVCFLIVLLVIIIKKMDNAMTNRALETFQTFMNKDYSNIQILDSAKSVFSHVKDFPETVENAVNVSKKQMDFISPSNEEALVMVFGSDNEYFGLRYSSEKELQVYATAGGTVAEILGDNDEKLIKINHGGELESQYSGCSTVYVSPLEKVKKGQLIASIRPGEQSCLSFSLWKNKEIVNPADYIDF